jgi:hypothetical protein
MIYVLKIIWDYRGAAIGTYRPQYRQLSAIRYLDDNPLPTRYTLFSTLRPHSVGVTVASLQTRRGQVCKIEKKVIIHSSLPSSSPLMATRTTTPLAATAWAMHATHGQLVPVVVSDFS